MENAPVTFWSRWRFLDDVKSARHCPSILLAGRCTREIYDDGKFRNDCRAFADTISTIVSEHSIKSLTVLLLSFGISDVSDDEADS